MKASCLVQRNRTLPLPAGEAPPFTTEVLTADSFALLQHDWRGLVERASFPNSFMEPAALLGADRAGDKPQVFLVWRNEDSSSRRRLVGAWAITIRKVVPWLPMKVLFAPISELAYVGTPVLEPGHAEAAFAALLDAMAGEPGLPKMFLAKDLNDQPGLVRPLQQALAGRGSSSRIVGRRTRAKLQAAGDPSYWTRRMSAKQRQSLAAKRRKLAALGKLTSATIRDPEGVASAFEAFLVLEAAGWKGQRHSAIASRNDWATFARVMVGGLARAGLVTVHELRLDDQPIAMWVVLYSGAAAFTWRTAYDESFARFSPGLLILQDTTDALIRSDGTIYADSCNHRDVGYQAERWHQRHSVVDVLIDLRPGRNLSFLIVAAAIMQTSLMRERVRRIYHRLHRRGPGTGRPNR